MTTAQKLAAAVYTVTNVKTFHGHDGYGYNATLRLNGTPIAMITEDGWGGCLQFDYYKGNNDGTRDAFEKYCRALPPLPPSKDFDKPLEMDEDLWVGEQVSAILKKQDEERQNKKLQKDLLTKTCFLKAGDKLENGWYSFKTPYSPAMKEHIEKKYPGATILNETHKTAVPSRLAQAHTALAATGVKKGDFIRWSNVKGEVVEGVVLRISTKTMTVSGVRKGESEVKEWRCPVNGKVEKIDRTPAKKPAPFLPGERPSERAMRLSETPAPAPAPAIPQKKSMFCPECGTSTPLREGAFLPHADMSGTKKCFMSNKCLWEHPSYTPPPGSGAALAAAKAKEEKQSLPPIDTVVMEEAKDIRDLFEKSDEEKKRIAEKGHDCHANPTIHMKANGNIDYVECPVCHDCLQVG